MNDITICLPFYMNAGMLREQCRRFRELPQNLKDRLHLIVVDDGSPKGMAEPQDVGFPFELYRITVDVRWNQDAARNLAVHHATTKWLLLTDIDHIPPQETLQALAGREYDEEKVYRFSRMTLEKDLRMTPYKPHPNSWFMTKAMYDRIGGYDESFAGYYGTDADFRDRLRNVAGEPVMLDEVLIRVPRDTIKDASTTAYGRKEEIDAELGKMIRRRNLTPGWQLKHLSFPWVRVK